MHFDRFLGRPFSFVLGCLVSLLVFVSQSAVGQLTQEDKGTLEWFGELGYEKIETLKFVAVETGWWSQIGNEAPRNRTIHAFLISDSGDEFEVISLELKRITFKRTPAETPVHERVRVEDADLVEYAKATVQPVDEDDNESMRRFGAMLSEAGEAVVLARACAGNDQPQLAHQLLDLARKLAEGIRARNGEQLTFQGCLEKDFANREMWRTILQFGESEVPRETLLAKLKRFKKNFPGSPHEQRVKSALLMLAKMVKEDAAHVTPDDFESLAVNEKVTELIFQLRNQRGEQWSQPGSCDIFSGDHFATEGEEPKLTPAGQLVRLGFDAVPQLIEVLDDKRFTRSVGFHRDFYFSHHVLRVGDCAERVLSRIANRRFYLAKSTSGEMLKDGEALSIKEQVEQWWAEVQAKGEKQVLVDAVAKGGDDSPAQAARLIEIHPLAALKAIREGIASSDSRWIRDRLIRHAAKLGEDSTDLLRKEMLEAPDLGTRVVAAEMLNEFIHEEAVEAMIAEWRGLAPLEKGQAEFSFADERGSLVRFLVGSKSTPAIELLCNDYASQPIRIRFDMLSEFRDLLGAIGREEEAGEGSENQNHQEIESLIEKRLVESLSDTDRRTGFSGSYGDYRFSDPRICDFAGYVLAKWFPGKYEIDANGSFDDRERQRSVAVNVWRKGNGLELLDEYQAREIERLPDAVTSEKLTAIIEATRELDQRNAIADYKSLGIGALPLLVEFLEEQPGTHDADQILKEIIKDLSTIVTKVVLNDRSVELDAAFKEKVQEFENVPLDSNRLVQLLASTAKDLPEGATGLEILAVRSKPELGIELQLEITTKTLPRNGTMRMWNTRACVVANGRNRMNSTGGTALDYAAQPQAYTQFQKAVDKALEGDPKHTLEITYSLIMDD